MGKLQSAELTATIAASGTDSSSIEVGGFDFLAVKVTDLTTDASVTVQASHDDTNWEELYDRELGTPADVTLAKQKVHIIRVSAVKHIRFVSATAQASARAIICRGM